MKQIISWFSCGASSAVAAKYAIEKYGNVEIVYCDTSKNEHPDNMRFLKDVENWLGQKIVFIHSSKYVDIYDVFDKTGYLVGIHGARCTTELKKIPRQEYSSPNAIHIIGLTYDERKRISNFIENNPELTLDWILLDKHITKQMCIDELLRAGIELPAMYKMGYDHNNCIGCVKAGMGYWNKIRIDFPEHFERMAKQERKMGVQLIKGVWLDELDPHRGRYNSELRIECGLFC